MQRETAHELHIEVPLLERALRGLTDRREDLREDVVERFALPQTLAEARGRLGQLGVGARGQLGLEIVHAGDDLAELTKLRLVGIEETGEDAHGDSVAS